MTHDQLVMLSTIGGGIAVLVAAAFLLLFWETGNYEIACRIGELRQGAVVKRSRSLRFGPMLVSLVRGLGNAMRNRMMSERDVEALVKTLTAAGLEPAKAMPIFIGAKIACLFGVPGLVYLGVTLMGYPTGKQVLYVGQEMKQSNRPVGVEFSLLTHEMRIMPDRRIALTNLAERTGQPALKRLAGTIAQTLKYGTPLSQGLRTLAADMRNERMIQFEERAGRLPALLVVPMILFILPSLFIIMMGQPVSQLFSSLAGMSH
jgi:hypothetical protein